ncbi:MAG: hypothetical protein DMG79_15625 [Acidobacteria bacterium]|nr:MAG: hypothetical protein DMG79_15625 [Acidobacteriota bacterium]
MREGIMGAEVLFARASAQENARPQESSVLPAAGWNLESFAREQIRGLVQQVFFSSAQTPVRQVVFSAIDKDTDVKSLCRRVGEELAKETTSKIAILGDYPQLFLSGEFQATASDRAPTGLGTLRPAVTWVGENLWLAPADPGDGVRGSTSHLHSYLAEIRQEFEYSIVAGPAAAESNQAMAMAQVADGIILVLSAGHTRRVTARKIKETFYAAQARILGTVLTDRVFPIPEGIYRRL